MIVVKLDLRDANERNAFNQFWSVIEKYRSGPVQEETAPVAAPAPAAEPDVVATITPEGVKVSDKRASRQVEMFPPQDDDGDKFHVEPAYTAEQVETRFREWATENKLVGARALLDKYKATRTSDIKPEDYAAIMADMGGPLVTA